MAVDFFLKIAEAPGESTDSVHKGEIDVLSWSWGVSNSGNLHGVGGGGAGKCEVGDVSFMTFVDKATPKLFNACATGQHLKTAVLVARKAGTKQQEFFKLTLTEVLVTSVQYSGHGGSDERPMASVTLNYGIVKQEYCAQKTDGTLEAAIPAGWDAVQNKPV